MNDAQTVEKQVAKRQRLLAPPSLRAALGDPAHLRPPGSETVRSGPLPAAPRIKGKGSWTKEEDETLRLKVQEFGRKWAHIAKYLPGRVGKQCRERYVNHLDPSLKKGEWSEEEERILIEAHACLQNKWAEIAKRIPGRCVCCQRRGRNCKRRSDNDAKNHWYSTIQRKYTSTRRKPGPAEGDILALSSVGGSSTANSRLGHVYNV